MAGAGCACHVPGFNVRVDPKVETPVSVGAVTFVGFCSVTCDCNTADQEETAPNSFDRVVLSERYLPASLKSGVYVAEVAPEIGAHEAGCVETAEGTVAAHLNHWKVEVPKGYSVKEPVLELISVPTSFVALLVG